VAITNRFGAGSINVIKKVTGDVAHRYGSGPFTLTMTCVLDDASGTRTVWDSTIKLGGGSPLHATVTDLAAGATCTITERDDGGSSMVTIDPSGPIPVDNGKPATVTVTNAFDPGLLYVDKKVTGAGGADAPKSFSVQVSCTADDGAVLAGFPETVHVSPGTPTKVPALLGAECMALETNPGKAQVTYDPAATDGSDGSGSVIVTGDTPHPPTITVTNTYPAAGTGPNRATGPLAGTGAPITISLWWGLALLVSGAALLVLTRLHRRHYRPGRPSASSLDHGIHRDES
jgi:hypothetical protein